MNEYSRAPASGPAPALPAPFVPPPADRWLEDHGDALYRYALPRVRRPEVAEDLVQETLLAALAGFDGFDGRASERTWLVSILKRKLIDHLRKSSAALRRAGSETGGGAAAGDDDGLFTRGGAWRARVPHWTGDPHAALERAEFRDVLARCLLKLPGRAAQLFWLREAEELETADLCRELNVSPDNVWTILHRARSRLRECLTVNWFSSGGRP